MMTDIEEIKRKLAELEERKKAEKSKKKVVVEPYGKELVVKKQPKPTLAGTREPVKVEKSEPEGEDPELERFSGDKVELTKEEFNAMMKHAEVGQHAIQEGMVQGVPRQVQPPQMVSPEPETLGEQIAMSKEQELPDGAFEEVSPAKKKRWFRRGGEPSEYVGEDKLTSRPTILYYDTDNTCKLVTGKLSKDGSLQIDDRLFDFSEGQPSILSIQRGKGRSSSHPFYILKYDNMNPIDVDYHPDSNPTPEQASRLVELQTLETLSRIEGGKMKKGPLIILMLVAFFGGFVMKLMLGLLSIW